MTTKTLFEREGIKLDAGDALLSLSGQPDFDNAAELADAGRKWLGRRDDGISIDLCGVESASTATLSVLLEWQRYLAKHGGHVAHLTLSPALNRLAAVSGLENLLPGLDPADSGARPPQSPEMS